MANPAPTVTKLPASIKPMLARLTRHPFDSPDHIFELKWDGFRALALIEGGRLRLLSRTSRVITSQFPEMEGLPGQVRSDGVVLDGELVCLDENNHPSFSLMQRRFQRAVGRPGPAPPVNFVAFDLLYLRGRSVMKEPLMERKERLLDVVVPSDLVQPSDFIETEGNAFFQATCDLGLEGVVAKAKGGLYYPGRRSTDWLKIKRVRESEFVVGGYSFGGKRQELFSSLLLGLHDSAGRLVFVGSVGTGFSETEGARIYEHLKRIHTEHRPFANRPDVEKFVYWCRPEMVCQVQYGEFTEEGRLRYPIYITPREDKGLADCTLADAPGWPRDLET